MIITVAETTGFAGAYGRIARHKKMMSQVRLSDAALAGADMADKLISVGMDRPKSGIFWGNLPERSSSPSETPAVQSGELIGRMETRKLASRPGVGTAALEANSFHAVLMEFGFMTKDGGFHIRPFMRPGIDKYRGAIHAAMRAEMR